MIWFISCICSAIKHVMSCFYVLDNHATRMKVFVAWYSLRNMIIILEQGMLNALSSCAHVEYMEWLRVEH
jgi:hypothetical protein